MSSSDLPEARALLSQLGYMLSLAEVAARFEAVTSDPQHVVFVAEPDGVMAGLVHAYQRVALEKPPEAVVQALVVDRAFRGHGIGRQLMIEAESWATERGLGSVCLSSAMNRDDAHEFYRSIGYQVAANSLWFRKATR